MATKLNKNAFKSGFFARAVILPDEDAHAYTLLRIQLNEEWMPDGPCEIDDLDSLTNILWIKRRIAENRRRDIERAEFHADGYKEMVANDYDVLFKFFEEYKENRLRAMTEQDLPDKLNESWAKNVNKAVPRADFKDDEEWRRVVLEYLMEKLSAIRDGVVKADSYDREFCNDERVMKDLALEDRLDAAKDKIIKRLGQTKTMKAMGLDRRRLADEQGSMIDVDAPSLQVEESAIRSGVADEESARK